MQSSIFQNLTSDVIGGLWYIVDEDMDGLVSRTEFNHAVNFFMLYSDLGQLDTT